MLFPIVCSCGKCLNHRYKKYKELTEKKDKDIWKKLNIKRICCKNILMTTEPLFYKINK
jgi:DNA-directed RNA polymerase subunit N (RpoN/RPB10)